MALNPDDYADPGPLDYLRSLDWLQQQGLQTPTSPFGQQDLTAIIPTNPTTLVPPTVLPPAPQPVPPRPGTMPGGVPKPSPTFPPTPSGPLSVGQGTPLPNEVPGTAPPEGPAVGDFTQGIGPGSGESSGLSQSLAESVPSQPLVAPKNPDDVAAAQAYNEAAQGRAAGATTAANMAQLDAEDAKASRVAAVLDAHAADQAQMDLQYQAQRQQLRADAQAETARWMGQLDEAARAEPNHQRYWSNTDRFGKALWIMGMLSGMAANIGTNNAGVRTNPALKMLEAEIAGDVQEQRDMLARRTKVLERQGDVLLRKQANQMADLQDDHTLVAQRLLSLREAAKVRAAAPGPEDRKQAYLAGVAATEQALAKTAQSREDKAYTGREAALNRSKDFAIAGMTDKRERELAQIKLDYEKEKDKNVKGADLRPLPRQVGFRVLGADGTERTLMVPKDEYKNVAKEADTANKLAVGYTKLRKSLAKTDSWDRLLQNDPAFVSAIEETAGAAVHTINSGNTTEEDISRAKRMTMGYDPNSIISMAKSKGQAATLAFLDSKIRDLNEQVSGHVAAYSGADLAPGEKIVYTQPPELLTDEPRAPTPTEARKAAGLPVTEPPHPTTVEELRAARAKETSVGEPGTYVPALPDAPAKAVEDFNTAAGKSGTNELPAWKSRAEKAIEQWQAEKPAERSAAAQDAKLRVEESYRAKYTESRDKMKEIAFIVGQNNANVGAVGRSAAEQEARAIPESKLLGEVKEEAVKRSLDLSPSELDELVRDARAAAAQYHVPTVNTTQGIRRAIGK